MRKFLIAIASLLAGPAAAADLPVKAPMAAPVQTCLWCGFYVGLNGGYGWNHENQTIVGLPGPKQEKEYDQWGEGLSQFGVKAVASGFIPSSLKDQAQGGVFGGQIGYNYVFQSLPTILVGVETDIQWADIHGSDSRLIDVTPFDHVSFIFNTLSSQKLDWYGTFRGRVGWLPTAPFLVYLTGGAAYGHVADLTSSEFTVTAYGHTLLDTIGFGRDDSTRFGWTVGAGFEYLLDPHWSVKTEYQFLDFGSHTTPFLLQVFNEPVPFTAHQRDVFNVVKVGVNYHWGNSWQ